MDRIVLDCKEKGCQRSVRWAVFMPDKPEHKYSCSNHLGKVIRETYPHRSDTILVALQPI